MNDDLITRLRSRSATQPQNFGLDDEAADRIEAQAARIAELESALRAAVSSLNTIADQAGRDEYMRDWLQVRGYAANRCAALAPKEKP